MSRRYFVLAFLLTFVILLTVPAWAQNQDTQGTATSISACTIIDKPGSYVLAKNITATQSTLKHIRTESACILILADFVTLDLRGYAITGPGTDKSAFGIYSTGSASGRWPIATHIRNGCVTKFNRGISVEGTGHTVEGVRVAENNIGIQMDAVGVKVKDVVATSNTYGIASFTGAGNSVENCQVYLNDGDGIVLGTDDPQYTSPGSRIVGNNVYGNGGIGIYVQCPSVILQNMAYDNPPGPEVEKHNIVLVEGSSGCTLSDNNPEP